MPSRSLPSAHDARSPARAGNAEVIAHAGIARLYVEHRAALLRYAERVLGGRRALAEDVVQEAFLRAHRASQSGMSPVGERAWLYAIVRNLSIDELRRHGRLVVDADPDRRPGPHDPVALVADREEVRAAVADLVALPDRQRQALVAQAVEGLSHDAVASRMDISPMASKALVNRGRATLTAARRARETVRALPAAA